MKYCNLVAELATKHPEHVGYGCRKCPKVSSNFVPGGGNGFVQLRSGLDSMPACTLHVQITEGNLTHPCKI